MTKGARHQRRDRFELPLAHSRRRLGRRAHSQARRDERAARVIGNRVAIRRDARSIEHLLSNFACQLRIEVTEVQEHHVILGAARDHAEALFGECRAEGLRVRDDLFGVGRRSSVGSPL